MLHLKCSVLFLLTLSFLVFFTLNPAFSQSQINVDSLTAVLNKYPKDDMEKAKLLVALSDALIEVNATEGIAYSDKALAIIANFNAPELKADALRAKADHLRVNNKLTEALDLANKALETYEQLRRTQKIAESHQLLGVIYNRKGDAVNALKNFERALVLCEQIGDWGTKIASLNGVGLVYMQSKDNQKAITYYEQAVALAQKLNDHKAEARSLGNIGTAYNNLGNNTQSIEYIKKAVVINESTGNQYYLIFDYRDLGNIYMKLMDIAKALDYYNKALTIAVEIGNKSQEAVLIKKIVLASKNVDIAIELLEKAVSRNEKIGDFDGMLNNYLELRQLNSSASNYVKAIYYCNKSLPIAIKTGNKNKQAECYAYIGFHYMSLGDYAKSIEYLQKALVLNESVKSNVVTRNIYIAFIEVYQNLSDYDKMLDYCNKALTVAKKTDNKNFEAVVYSKISNVYSTQNKFEEALEYIGKSSEIYRKMGNTAQLKNNLQTLGIIYDDMGRKLDAHRCYQEALTDYKKSEDKNSSVGVLINIASLYAEEPDSLVLQMGVSLSERYAKAAALATEALEISTKAGTSERTISALRVLSIVHEKNKDYRKAYETFKQYIELDDSIAGDGVMEQITRKEIQYEFDKKEIELKYQQQLTTDQLEKQKLLTIQGEQALTLNQQNLTLKEQALALSNKEKDLAHLAYLKEQAEKQEKTQELSLSQEREKGKERDLNIKNLELSAQQKQNLYWGLLAAVLLGGLGTLGYFYTTLKKKNTIIAQQNELNEHTIAILSHDIKEPLLGVKLLLKKLNTNDPFVAQASQSLEGQINSVNGILTNLLKMKKLSLVKKDKNTKANAQTVVQTVVKELSVAIQGKSLTIQNDLAEDMLLPIAPEKLQIIVHNLLSNAVKYSFPNKTIRIFKEGKGISIQDFGVGLSPEQRSKLMREVTASQQGTSQERGNGMGLFLVGTMLQGENIKVVFDSPEVGGTIVKVLG